MSGSRSHTPGPVVDTWHCRHYWEEQTSIPTAGEDAVVVVVVVADDDDVAAENVDQHTLVLRSWVVVELLSSSPFLQLLAMLKEPRPDHPWTLEAHLKMEPTRIALVVLHACCGCTGMRLGNDF